MPEIAYINKRFSTGSMLVIKQANEIIEEYQEQGFTLTLRQLFYQHVSRDLIANTQRSYKRLGSIVADARMAGMIDWDSLVDRTRNVLGRAHWDSPVEIIETYAQHFHVDLWEGQQFRPEVWIEKDALIGVIEDVCDEHDVSYFSCRGYTSLSEMWRAAQRLLGYNAAGQLPVIIHLGDHDPSGMDMSRDIEDRLTTFGAKFKFVRIALNMNQIEKYSPPPNPTKLTDSRATGYIENFGDESWELDALEPRVMSKLIEKTIRKFQDKGKWAERTAIEKAGQDSLLYASQRWDDIEKFLDE